MAEEQKIVFTGDASQLESTIVSLEGKVKGLRGILSSLEKATSKGLGGGVSAKSNKNIVNLGNSLGRLSGKFNNLSSSSKKGFFNISSGSNKAKGSISSLVAKVDELSAKIKVLSSVSKASFSSLKSSSSKSLNGIDRLNSKINMVGSSISKMGVTSKKGFGTISTEAAKARNNLSLLGIRSDKTGDKFTNLGKKVNKSFKKIDSSVKEATHSMSRMSEMVKTMFIFFAIDSVIKGIKGATNATLDMQAAFVKIKFATGDAAGSIAFLSEISDKFGTSFENSVSSFANFSAAAKGTRLEGAALEKVFRGLTVGMAANKVSADRQKLVLLAMEQMMSKGVVSAEELRRQMGEHLPGSFAIAARSMGMTTKSFNKLLAAGKIFTEDFAPKFAAQLEKELGTTAVAQADTASAGFIRLKNSIFKLSNAIGESGLVSSLSAVSDRLTAVFKIATIAIEHNDKVSKSFARMRRSAEEVARDNILERAVTVDGKKLLATRNNILSINDKILSLTLSIKNYDNTIKGGSDRANIFGDPQTLKQLEDDLKRFSNTRNSLIAVENSIVAKSGDVLTAEGAQAEAAMQKVREGAASLGQAVDQSLGNIKGLEVKSIYGKLYDGADKKIAEWNKNLDTAKKDLLSLNDLLDKLRSSPISNNNDIATTEIRIQNLKDSIKSLGRVVKEETSRKNSIKVSVDVKGSKRINDLKIAIGTLSPEVGKLQNKFLDLKAQIAAATNPEVIRLLRIEMNQASNDIEVAKGIKVASVYGKLFEGGAVRIEAFKSDIKDVRNELDRLAKIRFVLNKDSKGNHSSLRDNAALADKSRNTLEGLKKSIRSVVDERHLIKIRVDNAAQEKIIALKVSVGEMTKAEAESKRELMKFNLEMAKNPGKKIMNLLIKQHKQYIDNVSKGNTKLSKLAKGLEGVYSSSSSAFQKAMNETLMSGMSSQFQQTEFQFALMVDRMIEKASIANLSSRMFGDVIGSSSRNTTYGGGNAIGGPVETGKQYLVGENGPELFTPGTGGNITSNSDMRGGNTVVMNITTNDANSFAVNERQIIARLAYQLDLSNGRDK